MNWKSWVPLALALVLGLVAMMISKDLLNSNNNAPRDERGAMNEVVVAKRMLAAGSALRAADLSVEKMSGEPPESVFRSIAEVEGRVVTLPVSKGQPLIETLLAPKGTGSGLQALVPRGMRAITLEINEFSGLAGFLVPGCRVDVVSTINGGGGDEAISRMVVQNVEVTALGQRHQNEPGAAQVEPTRSVTLLVKPKEAEAIELAASTGRPRLVLRSSGDTDIPSTEGVTVAELIGRRSSKSDPFTMPVAMITPTPSTQPSEAPLTPVALERRPVRRMVKVIRGGIETQVEIEVEPEAGPKWITDAH
jgi:pilus assembly protein CpaB